MDFATRKAAIKQLVTDWCATMQKQLDNAATDAQLNAVGQRFASAIQYETMGMIQYETMGMAEIALYPKDPSGC